MNGDHRGEKILAICPYCKQEVSLHDVNKESGRVGFFKKEIMYSCPHCENILGFSRCNYG